MASHTEENYLKAIMNLADAEGEVSISGLSALLQVSKPTANSMIKNLERQGLVNYEKYKPLSLTQKGKTAAALVVRKHRLTERFLVERMGFGWEEVHEIAEQVEHINSVKFFERMDELLGYPGIDPHGSPIPDSTGQLAEQHYKPLSTGKPGDKVILKALMHSNRDFLEFLNSRNLKLGTALEVISKEAFDGTMVVRYENYPSETLSVSVCERLLVEEMGEE